MNQLARVVLFSFVNVPYIALADTDKDTDWLFNASLEELLKVEVSVASASAESVVDTPAIVSRYDRSDLEAMGVTSLKEMFNFVPGTIVQKSLQGWTNIQIRGIDEAFNQKVLFLLDGIPYHQPSHSLVPMEGIPWESISHIEVIRGPGAVFHGTQASAGVINVITRKDELNTASVKIGPAQLIEGSLYFQKMLDKGGILSLALEKRNEDSTSVDYHLKFPDQVIIEDTVSRKLERDSALVKYSYDNLQAILHAFNSYTVGANDGYTDLTTLQPIILDSSGYLLHINKAWESERYKANIYGDYNHYTFDFYINNSFGLDNNAVAKKDDNGKDDYRARVGGQINYYLNNSFDLVFGAEHEVRSVGAYRLYSVASPQTPLVSLFPNEKIKETSSYGQIEYHKANWRLFFGGRYTRNERSGSKITPRAGIVYKIDSNQSIKALYSTGFNSPNSTQTSIDLPGNVIGNKNLTAEVVEATDIAYSYAKSNILFVANIYHMRSEDFIVRQYVEEIASVTFSNENEYIRRGAEVDLQYATTESKVFANIAYQNEGNRQIADDLDAFRIPKLTLSIGASHNIAKNQTIGGSLSHIGSRKNIDSYQVVNLNYNYAFKQADFFITARNIFDGDILNPDLSSQASELVSPGEQGTNLHVGIRAKF